jgi:hypothetical protein
MRCCAAAVALTAVAGRAKAQVPSAAGAEVRRPPQSIRVTPENVRLTNYLHNLAGPGAFAAAIGGGLVDHLRQKPTAWNEGTDGLARQIASRAGQAAVTVSVRHGLAALMHRSTDYQPCDCHGFGHVIEHALLETFTDRREDGTRALSVPRLAGAYAGSFARMTWEPGHDAGRVAMSTTMSLGFSALLNIARELSGAGR